MRWQLLPSVAASALALLSGTGSAAAVEPEGQQQEASCQGECPDEEPEAPSSVVLLQTQLSRSRTPTRPASSGAVPVGEELAFVHVPYNFGHTIEKVAAFGSGAESLPAWIQLLDSFGSWSGAEPVQGEAKQLPPVPGVLWGHVSPLLQEISNVTGCPLYYSPQKYWPKDVAEKYIGRKPVVGLLRDPYERLVAGFRGNLAKYGASSPELFASCDVNTAIKQLMKSYLAGSTFAKQCSLLPQAEYFDGPYGITLPVNNRQFPESSNQLFTEHGHPEMNVSVVDIFHVRGCTEVWSGDLDNETKSLVRHVYKRDFELLCKHFGYCNDEEDTCLWQVPEMCPQRVLASGYRG